MASARSSAASPAATSPASASSTIGRGLEPGRDHQRSPGGHGVEQLDRRGDVHVRCRRVGDGQHRGSPQERVEPGVRDLADLTQDR